MKQVYQRFYEFVWMADRALTHSRSGLLRRFLRAIAPDAVVRFMYQPERHKAEQSQAKKLLRALWAGYGTIASEKLKMMQARPRVDFTHEVAWNLACWHHSRGEFEQALNQLTLNRGRFPASNYDPGHVAVEVDCLLGLGQADKARTLVEAAIRCRGEHPVLCLSLSNLLGVEPGLSRLEADRLRLQWLSKPLIAAELAPLEFKDPARQLDFGNVTAVPASREDLGPKISVLMPACNAETTIGTAIESIINQSWTNLELIVVDDCSSDGTWSVVESFAERDARVKPTKHSANRGAYAARNTALNMASGELITVSDADDWSHPQRLAIQARHLLETGAPCNTTASIRIDHDFRILIMPKAKVIRESFPSLMVRHKHILELGGWDEVRMGADAEFYARLLAQHRHVEMRLMPDTPLMVQLSRVDSLTSVSHTGHGTTRYGARREYTEAFKFWHKIELARGSPLLRRSNGRRPFPVPAICYPVPPRKKSYDILFVSDFAQSGDVALRNVALLRDTKQLGLDIACFHWPTLDTTDRSIDDSVRQLLHDGMAQSVVAGERLTCRAVLVSDVRLLEHVPDILPKVHADKVVVMVDPRSTTQGSSFQSRIDGFVQNAQALFDARSALIWCVTRNAPLSAMLEQHIAKE